MTWARFDDGFYENRKIVPLSAGAFRMCVCAIIMSRQLDLDGRLTPQHVQQLRRLHRIGEGAVAELVDGGLWRTDGDDRLIHDYEFYAPPEASTIRTRKWRERHGNVRGTSQNGRERAPVPVPVPGVVINNSKKGRPPEGFHEEGGIWLSPDGKEAWAG